MSDSPQDLRSLFGFHTLPFTREIPIRDRWSSPIFEQPLSDLCHSVQQRMSAALIAASGTGKTLLLRALAQQLPEARYRCHYVKVTSLSKRDLCREIATVLGLQPPGTYPALVRALQEAFRDQATDQGLQPLLLLDEAGDMRPEVLAILRILTNFDMDSTLVLAVVLAGNHQLQRLLERPDLEPVRRRLAHVASLRLLSRAETRDYMQHRIRVVGGKDLPFDDPATDAIYEITRGNLRAINYLARKALHKAAEKNLTTIDTALVIAARKDLML
jgi:type II secretory pathway predicted ATPase ExeA